MDFGDAIRALKAGKRVTRKGWHGNQPGPEPRMWLRRIDLYSDREFSVRESPASRGTWQPFIVLKTPADHLVPWSASQADVEATDWQVVEEPVEAG